MINGLGVLGWGVGGIEAEAAMLGQPVAMLIPEVVGFKLTGKLPEGATGTDLVLRVTEMLRAKGVVGKFVEFYGTGLTSLPLAARATIANMAPEYGATMGFFPVDAETLNYLRFSGRDEDLVQLVEAYSKAQGMFRTDETPDPVFSDTLELDLAEVEPAIAGPKRPQDRVPLKASKSDWEKNLLGDDRSGDGERGRACARTESTFDLHHGSVVIAAITSCTNTSNPEVMLGAGLLAKKAVEKGLKTPPWVKTEPRARFAGRDRVPRRGGRDAVPRTSWASTWSGTAARPASGTPGRSTRRSRPRSRSPTSSPRRCSAATATSKAA